MTKIKYINCFGTSNTAGGGFEFDSPTQGWFINKLYGHISNEEKTIFNFSYPGQIQKLVSKNVKVNNFGKQGCGNERVIRKSYEIIDSHGFNKDEHIFIFEITGLGRREFFFKKINDYIICNYQIDETDKAIFLATANHYNYDSVETIKLLESYDPFFKTYLTDFFDIKNEVDEHRRMVDLFLAYLESKNINYYFTMTPQNHAYRKSTEFLFGDGKYFQQTNDMMEFSFVNKLTIKDETYKQSNDMHIGLRGNKLIANVIYNKLVTDGMLDTPIKEIDWETYKNTKYIIPKVI